MQEGNRRDTDLGPTWRDIKEGMEELLTLYEGYVHIELTIAPARIGGQSQALWARVVWRDSPGTLGSPERASGEAWPSHGHRTMPGMLHKHIILLERKLEDMVHDRVMAEQRAALGNAEAELNLKYLPRPKKGA